MLRIRLLRFRFLCLLLCCACLAAAVTPEQGKAALNEGLLLMQQAQQETVGDGTIVKAAISLMEAKHIFEALGDNDALVEVRSCLYWCKKKMTNQELDLYLAAVDGDEETKVRIQAMVSSVDEAVAVAVQSDDAEDFLASAQRFAEENIADPFRVHVRFIEVAERFGEANPVVAIKANRLASDALKIWVEQVSKELAAAKQDAAAARKEAAAANKQLDRLKELGIDTIFEKKVVAKGDTVPPDPRTLRNAQKEVAKLYAVQLASPDRNAAARFLLKEAQKSKDQPEVCYALALEALDVAGDRKVCDLWTVLKATEFLGKTFKDIDPDALRQAAFKKMGKIGEAGQALAVDPEDPTANTWAGLSVAFGSGELKAGLAMLQLSGDVRLAKAAQMEAIKPQNADEKVQLAELWDEVGDDRSYKDLTIPVSARALHWYEAAVTGLSGASQRKVTTRIAELHAKVPLSLAEVDLKKLTDEQWKRLAGVVVEVDARKTVKTRLQLGAGEQVRVVPLPSGRWEVGTYSGSVACSWKGDATYYMTEGRLKFGALAVYLDNVDRPLEPGVIVGPGLLLFEQYRGPAGGWSQNGASSRGSIPVKVIPLIEGF